MIRLHSVGAELLGLFVDDGAFAAAILAWLAVAWLVLPRLGLAPGLPPVLLAVGLAAILVASAARQARRRGRDG